MNRVVNAQDTSPKAGPITLLVKPRAHDPGRYGALETVDTRVGIDDALERPLFDPFFTTQAPGTWPGLVVVAGDGATFRVLFPHVAG